MAGKAKYAEKLAKHLDADIDAACMINKAGATAIVAATGVVGMAVDAAVRRGPKGDEIKVVRTGWLAVGPDSFALVNGDNVLGNPKGEPYASIQFADVDSVAIKQGKITARADVLLSDGRGFAFETKRRGVNEANPEVLALLAERCR
jgi:hypothetical protein